MKKFLASIIILFIFTSNVLSVQMIPDTQITIKTNNTPLTHTNLHFQLISMMERLKLSLTNELDPIAMNAGFVTASITNGVVFTNDPTYTNAVQLANTAYPSNNPDGFITLDEVPIQAETDPVAMAAGFITLDDLPAETDPVAMNAGFVTASITNGVVFTNNPIYTATVQKANAAYPASNPSNYFADAPSNNIAYVRKNKAWTNVPATSGFPLTNDVSLAGFTMSNGTFNGIHMGDGSNLILTNHIGDVSPKFSSLYNLGYESNTWNKLYANQLNGVDYIVGNNSQFEILNNIDDNGIRMDKYTLVSSEDGKYQYATIENTDSLFISQDYGRTWTTNEMGGDAIYVKCSSDGDLVIARVNEYDEWFDIAVSTDYGSNFESIGEGDDYYESILSISDDCKTIVLAKDEEYSYLYSTDGGLTWQEQSFSGSGNHFIVSMVVSGDGRYIFKQTDDGFIEKVDLVTGALISSGEITGIMYNGKFDCSYDGSVIVYSTYDNMIKYDFNSQEYTTMIAVDSPINISSNGNVMAVTSNNYVIYSTDSGSTWINSGILNYQNSKVNVSSDGTISLFDSQGHFVINNVSRKGSITLNGDKIESWAEVGQVFDQDLNTTNDVVFSNITISSWHYYGSSNTVGSWRTGIESNNYVRQQLIQTVTTNDYITFPEFPVETFGFGFAYGNLNSIDCSYDGKFVAAMCGHPSDGYANLSTNYGQDFSIMNIRDGAAYQYKDMNISSNGQYLSAIHYGGIDGRLYHSSNYGSTWTTNEYQLDSFTWMGMSDDGQSFITSTDDNSVFRYSTDGGENWSWYGGMNNIVSESQISPDGKVMINPNVITPGTELNNITTNAGSEWYTISLPIYNKYSKSIRLSYDGSTVIYFDGVHSPVYKSSDYGTTWNQLISGDMGGINDISLSYDGRVIAVLYADDGGEWTQSIAISIDYGSTWYTTNYYETYNINNIPKIKVSPDGNVVYCMTDPIIDEGNEVNSQLIKIETPRILTTNIAWTTVSMGGGCDSGVEGTPGLIYELNSNGLYDVVAYTGSDLEVVIPYCYNGTRINTISADATGFENITNFISFAPNFEVKTRIVVGSHDAIIHVPYCSLSDSDSLISITLDNVEKIEYIVSDRNRLAIGPFAGNASIIEFIAPKLKDLDERFFYMANGLMTAYLPNLESVKDNTFMGTSLTSIDLPKVKEIGTSAFKGCSTLTTINAPLCLEMKNEVFENSGLTIFDFPSLITIGTKCIPSSVTAIDLPKITKYDGTFEGYQLLGVVKMDSLLRLNDAMFKSCPNLYRVYLRSVIYAGDQVFMNCENLIGGEDVLLSSLEISGTSLFRDCYQFTGCSLKNLKEVGEFAFANTAINQVGASAVDNYNPGLKLPSIRKLASGSFIGCDNLTEVRLPSLEILESAVFGSSTDDNENAWEPCSMLTKVVLDNATYIGGGTFSRTAVSNVSIPKAVYVGGYAFANTPVVASSTNGEFNLLSAQRLGAYAFYNTPYLKKFSAPTVHHVGWGGTFVNSAVSDVYMPALFEVPTNMFVGANYLTNLVTHTPVKKLVVQNITGSGAATNLSLVFTNSNSLQKPMDLAVSYDGSRFVYLQSYDSDYYSDWQKIFTSSDPTIWDTDTGTYGVNPYAKSLASIHDGVQKARINYSSYSKTVDVNNAQLGTCLNVGGTLYWNGTKTLNWNGRHLGITDSSHDPGAYTVSAGYPCMNDKGSWGFGHRRNIGDKQGFAWYGVKNDIQPVPVVDISVYLQYGSNYTNRFVISTDYGTNIIYSLSDDNDYDTGNRIVMNSNGTYIIYDNGPDGEMTKMTIPELNRTGFLTMAPTITSMSADGQKFIYNDTYGNSPTITTDNFLNSYSGGSPCGLSVLYSPDGTMIWADNDENSLMYSTDDGISFTVIDSQGWITRQNGLRCNSDGSILLQNSNNNYLKIIQNESSLCWGEDIASGQIESQDWDGGVKDSDISWDGKTVAVVAGVPPKYDSKLYYTRDFLTWTNISFGTNYMPRLVRVSGDGNYIYVAGTNMTSGISSIYKIEFINSTLVTNIQTLESNWHYYGNTNQDGCWRSGVINSNFAIQNLQTLITTNTNNIVISSDFISQSLSGDMNSLDCSYDGKYIFGVFGDPNDGNCYISDDYGTSFNFTDPYGDTDIHQYKDGNISSNGQYVAVIRKDSSYYLSDDQANSWTEYTGWSWYFTMAENGTNLVKRSDDGTDVTISFDGGNSWQQAPGITHYVYEIGLSGNGTVIILSYDEEEAYISTNSGTSFTSIVVPLTGALPETHKYSLNYDGSVILIYDETRLYKSTDYGATWQSIENTTSIIMDASISYDGQIIAVAGSDDGGEWDHRFAISLDSGSTWMSWDYWLLSASDYPIRQIKVSGDGSKIYMLSNPAESYGSTFIKLNLEDVFIHNLIWVDALSLSRPE